MLEIRVKCCKTSAPIFLLGVSVQLWLLSVYRGQQGQPMPFLYKGSLLAPSSEASPLDGLVAQVEA